MDRKRMKRMNMIQCLVLILCLSSCALSASELKTDVTEKRKQFDKILNECRAYHKLKHLKSKIVPEDDWGETTRQLKPKHVVLIRDGVIILTELKPRRKGYLFDFTNQYVGLVYNRYHHHRLVGIHSDVIEIIEKDSAQ